MSLHSSLKTSGNLTGKRSVMKRHERVEVLKDQRNLDVQKEGKLVMGLPKTKVPPGM